MLLTLVLTSTFFSNFAQGTDYDLRESSLTDELISRQSTGQNQISNQNTLRSIHGSAMERILQREETNSEVNAFELSNQSIAQLNDRVENNQNILMKIERMETPTNEEDIRQLIYQHLEPHLPFLYNDIEMHKLYNPEIHQIIEEKLILMLAFYGSNHHEMEATVRSTLREKIITCMKMIEEEVARGAPCWLCQYDKYTTETTIRYAFVPISGQQIIDDFREETTPLCQQCKKIQEEISSAKLHWIELSGRSQNNTVVSLRFSTRALLPIEFNTNSEFHDKYKWYKEFLCDDYPFSQQNLRNLPVVFRQIHSMVFCHYCMYCNEVTDDKVVKKQKIDGDYCSLRHRIMHKIATPLKYALVLTQFYFKAVLLILLANLEINPHGLFGEFDEGWDWDYTLGHPMKMKTALAGVLFEPFVLLILYCYRICRYREYADVISLYHYYYYPQLPEITDSVPILKLNIDVPFPEYQRWHILGLLVYIVFFLINFQPKIIIFSISIIIALGVSLANYKDKGTFATVGIFAIVVFFLYLGRNLIFEIYYAASSVALLLITIGTSFLNISTFTITFLKHLYHKYEILEKLRWLKKTTTLPVKVTYFIIRLLAKGLLLYICMHEELTGEGGGAKINDTYNASTWEWTWNHPIIMPIIVPFISLESILSLFYIFVCKCCQEEQEFETTMFYSFFPTLTNYSHKYLYILESLLYSVFILVNFYAKIILMVASILSMWIAVGYSFLWSSSLKVKTMKFILALILTVILGVFHAKFELILSMVWYIGFGALLALGTILNAIWQLVKFYRGSSEIS